MKTKKSCFLHGDYEGDNCPTCAELAPSSPESECDGPLADSCWSCPYCDHVWVQNELPSVCPLCKKDFETDEPSAVPDLPSNPTGKEE